MSWSRSLLALDAACAFTAWFGITLIAAPGGRSIVVAAIATAIALVWLGTHGMYRASMGNARLRDTAHVYEAAAWSAVAANMADSVLGVRLGAVGLIVGAFTTGILLQLGRYTFHAAVSRSNRNGRNLRPTVLVGPAQESADLAQRLRAAPELGFSVVGYVADPDLPTLPDMVRSAGGQTVMVLPGTMTDERLARLVRRSTNAGLNVHVVGGMTGIDPRRLAPVRLGRDVSVHVSCVSLDGWQSSMKRFFDVCTTLVLLGLTAPLLLVAGVAVKLGDRGPVLFRQERVGRDGRPFTMLKFRSMVVDAESRLDEVSDGNHRTGPLFKLTRDPRVTAVGRVLRATSMDELPQLFNVLRGDMSIVGPRPALAHEVAQFSPELQRRHVVLPGITGLWQIEGRDDPDFAAYEASDLYYVENWSVALDIAIMVRTFVAIMVRIVRSVRRSRRVAVLD